MAKMDAEDRADAKKGIKQTPAEEKADKSYMGHQGSPVTIKPNHFMNKSTGQTSHPAMKSNSKGAKKFNHG